MSFLDIDDIHNNLQSRASKAWEALYVEGFRKVKRVLSKTSIEKEDIENIFQDCIAKLWDAIFFNRQDFSDKTNDYYFAVLVNCSNNASKNKYNRIKKFSEIAEMLKYRGQEITEVDELWFQQLKELIFGQQSKVLPEKEKIAFRMHFEGYPYDEIAEELGMQNADSAKNVKHSAIKKLRDFLRKNI